MRLNSHHVLKAIILGYFMLFFIQLQYSGDIIKYINPKYDVMSKIAAGVFIVLFIIQLPRMFKHKHKHHVCTSHCHHDHGNTRFGIKRLVSYCVIAFPLITGFTMEPVTLNASIASNKGTVLPQANKSEISREDGDSLLEDASSLAEKEGIDIYSDEFEPLPNNNYLSNNDYEEKLNALEVSEVIQMSDDMYGSYYSAINENPREYVGRKIKVNGFVYKEEGLTTNQLVISRFMITHCIADASILGFLTEFEEANTYEEDTWIEIEGVLDVALYNGYELPIIRTSEVKVIEEPIEPYVYPVLTLVQG
nr:TIGR03943 family protein [Lysinibacillus timonensis]